MSKISLFMLTIAALVCAQVGLTSGSITVGESCSTSSPSVRGGQIPPPICGSPQMAGICVGWADGRCSDTLCNREFIPTPEGGFFGYVCRGNGLERVGGRYLWWSCSIVPKTTTAAPALGCMPPVIGACFIQQQCAVQCLAVNDGSNRWYCQGTGPTLNSQPFIETAPIWGECKYEYIAGLPSRKTVVATTMPHFFK